MYNIKIKVNSCYELVFEVYNPFLISFMLLSRFKKVVTIVLKYLYHLSAHILQFVEDNRWLISFIALHFAQPSILLSIALLVKEIRLKFQLTFISIGN